MPPGPTPAELRSRLALLVEKGAQLEVEGVPYPTAQLKENVDGALARGAVEEAEGHLKRGESLYSVAARDWGWVRETLARADELRTLAADIGVDLQHLDKRVGNPREQLRNQPLTASSLGRAAASASLAVAVLQDAVPKYCVQESQKLGESIRAARNRGEDVSESVRHFAKLLQAISDNQVVQTTRLLTEVRRAVARIPRAPAMAVPTEEEEEILMEARNLARRLQRIKSKARNTQNAARLMTQVRAALSEDRRFGTPEEEIEALWEEVDRLAKERADGDESPLPPAPGTPDEPVAKEAAGALASPPALTPPEGASEEDDADPFGPTSPSTSRRRSRHSL